MRGAGWQTDGVGNRQGDARLGWQAQLEAHSAIIATDENLKGASKEAGFFTGMPHILNPSPHPGILYRTLWGHTS
jgi:hypothetical protein